MQLRSGTVTSANNSPARRSIRCPDYVPNPVEIAKFKVRQQVKARQRKMADTHIRKFIDKEFTPTVHMFMSEMDMPPTNEDPFMHKVRVATYLFSYLNSKPDYIIMNPKLMKFRSIAFKQCDQFKKDGEKHIKIRINCALDVLPDLQETNPKKKRTPDSIRSYYMTYLNAMLDETEHFKATYGNRL